MVVLHLNIFLHNFHFLFKIILFFTFLKRFFTQFFYPHSITLLNGNILIIYQDGIKIYDSSMEIVINTTEEFSMNDTINSNDIYNKIIISRFSEDEYGYIISIINDKLYIFAFDGTLLFKSETKLKGEYYSIIPIKGNQNNSIYMIGEIRGN